MASATIRLERARSLRRNMTEAEKKLWAILRNRNVGGAQFRRQVPVGPYIADFLCGDAGLIVEADGGQHADNAADAARDQFLRQRGFQVMRFWNNEILSNLDGVAAKILIALETTPHPPTAARRAPPSPSRGEGLGDTDA